LTLGLKTPEFSVGAVHDGARGGCVNGLLNRDMVAIVALASGRRVI
jgi:hypothetical protein